MAESTTHKAVVFITRSGFQLFSTAAKGVYTYNYDMKHVRDLDVVDPQGFSSQIHTFIEGTKLPASPVLFIFSEPATFYQDVKESDLSKLESIKEEFVNTVPYETLLTKSYNIKGGIRIMSINERLYREIASAFETKGYLSVGVVPTLVLSGRGTALTALDPSSAMSILAEIEQLREQSFFSAHKGERGEDIAAPGTQKPLIENKFRMTKSLVALAILFVVLIGVFAFLLMRQS